MIRTDRFFLVLWMAKFGYVDQPKLLKMSMFAGRNEVFPPPNTFRVHVDAVMEHVPGMFNYFEDGSGVANVPSVAQSNAIDCPSGMEYDTMELHFKDTALARLDEISSFSL